MVDNLYTYLYIAEPRGNNDQFEQLLQDFYRAVKLGKLPLDGNAQGFEKKQQHHCQNVPMRPGNRAGGAAFLAVCRGKVRSIIPIIYFVLLMQVCLLAAVLDLWPLILISNTGFLEHQIPMCAAEQDA